MNKNYFITIINKKYTHHCCAYQNQKQKKKLIIYWTESFLTFIININLVSLV